MPLPILKSWDLPGLPVRIREPCGSPPSTDPVLELPAWEGMPALRWLRPTPEEVERLAGVLRKGRDERLLPLRTGRLLASLGRVGRRFQDPGDPLRREALEGLPAGAGISAPMAREILDGMAADWTEERLELLLRAEFQDPSVLETFVAAPRGRRIRALGSPLLVQVVSGSVPGVSTTALLRGLLVRSATLVKPGRGDLLLPLLWLRGLREEDPGLADCAGIHYWPGGDPAATGVEGAWLAEAQRVVVYGGAEAVAAARGGARPGVRVVAYPHRVGVALVGREVQSGGGGARAAEAAARAVGLFDGRGCVSLQVVFVEGGEGEVAAWAEELARALSTLAQRLPPGRLTRAEAAAIQHLRGTAELRGAAGSGERVLAGEGTAWTVVLDPAPGLRSTCPGRVVRVVPVGDLAEVPERLRPLTPHLQTAALTTHPTRVPELAEALARVGVTRVTSLEGAPWPPPWWHHDGEGPLRALVRWTELEAGGEW